MKVLLIHTELNPGTIKNAFHFGLGSIAAYLTASGHDVVFERLTDHSGAREKILSAVNSINPGIIGFSVMSDEWVYVKQIASWIKDNYKIPIICGGPHPTVAPDDVIGDVNIDFICRGEGEEAMAELCSILDKDGDVSGTQNLWIRDGNTIVKNQLRPLMQDLDSLPFPAFKLLDYQKSVDATGIARLMLGKGCPFKCSYCINAEMQHIYRGKGRYVRKRSPEKSVELIKSVISDFANIHSFGFDDEVFVLDRKWLDGFSALYKKEIGLPFECYMRVEYINRALLATLYETGCRCLSIGVESGSQWLRKNVLNRNMTNADIIEKFKMIDEFGIHTISLNMIGLPYENPQLARETLELNRIIRPSVTVGTLFQPYPGTRLYEICRDNNWIRENPRFIDKSHSVLNMPDFSQEECIYYADRLNHLGYSISVKKNPAGIFDFLEYLDLANIESVYGRQVEISKFERLGDFVLKAIPPAKITFSMLMPEKSRLCFGIGMHDGLEANDGTLFIVEIRHGQNFREKEVLFSKYLKFSHNIKGEGWLPCSIDLGKYGHEFVELSFITREGPRTDSGIRAAGWLRPHIQRSMIDYTAIHNV